MNSVKRGYCGECAVPFTCSAVCAKTGEKFLAIASILEQWDKNELGLHTATKKLIALGLTKAQALDKLITSKWKSL